RGTGAAVAGLAPQGSGRFAALTVTLAITTGVIGVIAGLARLGFLASFISEPVLKGFIIGLALTIVVGQLPELFGVEKGSGNFLQKLLGLLTRLGRPAGPPWPSGWPRWPWCWGCAWPRSCPGPWSPSW